MNRVVITGMSAITSLGQDWKTLHNNLLAGNNAVVVMDDWSRFEGLRTRLAAPIPDFIAPKYGRKKVRSMGRVALMATRSSELALEQAGLLNEPVIQSGDMGIAYGSSSGTPKAMEGFGQMLLNDSMDGMDANTYIKMMSHTTAVNLDVFFGIKGRVIPTSSACTSGSQGIGYAYESIKYGLQTMMLAGGAEELDATQAAVFDTLFATSIKNDQPELSPRPFDANRDGLVIGEGAATLVLESLDHAQARGATIIAEVIGYHCNSDGQHITQPNVTTMKIAMAKALEDANIDASVVGYVNAHGTATEKGDIAESHATNAVFGSGTPVSSLKSYLGHTLGACGAIEAVCSVEMMNSHWFSPTLNLDQPDPECAELDYIVGEGRKIKTDHVVSNNFAFGGINTSLVFKRWQEA